MIFTKEGICIANKMIINATNMDSIQEMVKILADNIVTIIQNPFGNYAITTSLEVRKLSFNFL